VNWADRYVKNAEAKAPAAAGSQSAAAR
jgi:hypothetical protein